MLKLRLKRGGCKRQPAYRIVVIRSDSPREGKAIESLGFYKPISNEFVINTERVKVRLAQGVQPTKTVKDLLLKAGIINA
jgi:small subunit ribosomal protein S16